MEDKIIAVVGATGTGKSILADALAHTLGGEVVLTSNAHMNTAGTYAIVPSGAIVPNTDNYHETIIYVNGLLTERQQQYRR